MSDAYGLKHLGNRIGHLRRLVHEMRSLIAQTSRPWNERLEDMADEIDNAVQAVKDAAKGVGDRVAAATASLEAQIATLQGEVPANLAVDIQALKDAAAALDSIDPAPAPTPPPDPTPTP